VKGIPPRTFLIFWFPVLAYCVIIFIASSMERPLPDTDIPNLDKFLHMVEYGILSYLIIRALMGSEVKLPHGKLIVLAVIFATLYGASDEAHQMFVPGRTAEISDLLADLIGASAAGFLKR